MAHNKVYGICESKCQVEVYSKEQVDKMTYHTDWAKLPLKSGVGAATLGRKTPQYKKIGNQVFIRGTANVKPSENGIVIATVPSGFEPNAQEYFRQYAEGTRVAQLLVKPSGEIKLDWVANISDGKKYTESLNIQLNMSYFID